MTKPGTRRNSRELAFRARFKMDMGQQTTNDVRLTFGLNAGAPTKKYVDSPTSCSLLPPR